MPDDETMANLIAIGGFVYFTADDGVHGTELWRIGLTPRRRAAQH